MRPTQMLRSSGEPNPKLGNYIGNWGAMGGTKQKGIIQWGLSANRQNPFAGAGHDAVFNTFRRTKGQIFYWLPALATGYYIMNWAIEKNEHLNSKAGRAETALLEGGGEE